MLLVIAAGVVWLAVYQRNRMAAASPAGMLRRLPPENATVLFVDFDTLRRGGVLKLLASSKTAEEPDYQTFVRATGFDYQKDLDTAAVSFSSDGEFFVVKGRFDWPKLRAYAEGQGGGCEGRLCRMQGSTPARRISFLPLQPNLMALAVSTDASAATRLAESSTNGVQPLDPPRDPVWLSVPAESLKAPGQLPPGRSVLHRRAGIRRQDFAVTRPRRRSVRSETAGDLPHVERCRSAGRSITTCHCASPGDDRSREPEAECQGSQRCPDSRSI